MISGVLDDTWRSNRRDEMQAEIQKLVEHRVLQHLFELSLASDSLPETRAIALEALRNLKTWINTQLEAPTVASDWTPHYRYALQQIQAFEEDPSEFKPSPPSRLPDGSPIGSHDEFSCHHLQHRE